MPQRVLLAIGEMSGGGSERQILGILQHLDRKQYQPELYLISAQGELLGEVPADVPVHIFEQRKVAPVSRLPGSRYRAQVRDLAELLDERRIDLIYDRTHHMTLITSAATRKRPTPRISVIVTNPQLDFEANPERFRRIKWRLLRSGYLKADIVAAVSEGARQSTADYYRIPLDRIETVYNFFDVDRIDQLAQAELPDTFEKKNDCFHLVAAGRLHSAKGFDILIDAVRAVVFEFGHTQLLLTILGTGELRSRLEQQIRETRLEKHVRLAGFHKNPLTFYRHSDLFVLSSRYEGMPNVLVEAMLCRVPVLSTDCRSGPKEILQQGRLGQLVPGEDSSALATAIDDAIRNYTRWQQPISAARAHIVDLFSTETGIQRTTRLFERAVENFRGSAR